MQFAIGFGLALALSSSAFAQSDIPIFIKTTQSGFINPAAAFTETCTVYDNRVVVQRVTGTDDTVITFKSKANTLAFDPRPAINTLLGAPTVENLSLPDVGTFSYVGLAEIGCQSYKPVTMYSSSMKIDLPKVDTLVDQIDEACSFAK